MLHGPDLDGGGTLQGWTLPLGEKALPEQPGECLTRPGSYLYGNYYSLLPSQPKEKQTAAVLCLCQVCQPISITKNKVAEKCLANQCMMLYNLRNIYPESL